MFVSDGESLWPLLLFMAVPFLLGVLFLVGVPLILRRRGWDVVSHGGDAEWERVSPPWWGRPFVWVAVCATFLVLGLFVIPHFLGGTLLFLPFVWIGGWRRRPR